MLRHEKEGHPIPRKESSRALKFADFSEEGRREDGEVQGWP